MKRAQYADDTTVFVKDVQSINNLFNLLEKFESVSGLRINQSKLELLWLGSSCLSKDKILSFKLSEEPIYALGIYFSYNDELATKKTFMINLGRYRKFSTFGHQETFLFMAKLNGQVHGSAHVH